MADEVPDDENDVEAEIVQTEVNDQADPKSLVEGAIPEDLREKYSFASYGRALSVLVHGFPDEFSEIVAALRDFSITTDMIRKPGGNESDIPKVVSGILRPKGWHETTIRGNLVTIRNWKVLIGKDHRGRSATMHLS